MGNKVRSSNDCRLKTNSDHPRQYPHILSFLHLTISILFDTWNRIIRQSLGIPKILDKQYKKYLFQISTQTSRLSLTANFAGTAKTSRSRYRGRIDQFTADVDAVCGLVCWPHCCANAPTRFISTVYKCKRWNDHLHNAMHYATINMRRVGSPRRDVTGPEPSTFRNFGRFFQPPGIGSVYSIYILIERHPFARRTRDLRAATRRAAYK